jgi:hypothetical protein
VIVVIGSPMGRFDDDAIAAGGMASRIALAAAAAGRSVQLVGKTGDDPTADGVVLDLARGGVGHVALLRDPARVTPIEAAPADEDADHEVVTDAPSTDVVQPTAAVDPDPADGPSLEAADVDLGLRYLTEFAVVVLAEPADRATVAIVADAASWGGARMILVVAAGSSAPDDLPADVVVFEAPDADPDGVFAALVGSFAAAMDDGIEPAAAFQASIATDGWTGAADA